MEGHLVWDQETTTNLVYAGSSPVTLILENYNEQRNKSS